MTVQHLKYLITAAEKGSVSEAAKALFISQPSLSGAIKEVEKEAGITVFNRHRTGVSLTKEGMEFLGYARQVVEQMELLEDKYVKNQAPKQRFCVSTQHYTFTANAFVELVLRFGQDRYEFILNETQTHQIIEDVRNRFSNVPCEKSIRVSDRAAVVNFMIGLDGYTISSGIVPKLLHGDEIIAVELDEGESMRIGYIINKDSSLSELGRIYVDELRRYRL